ncbi:hypothetical protein WMY93_022310 [Mugilogobius chulae]|uniref:L1 transposable element RRM domain-containing protein n=1 Tax=Mugilogobius chulae TaxID=88201 RepID=A0AAW0N7S4_9GOBI
MSSQSQNNTRSKAKLQEQAERLDGETASTPAVDSVSLATEMAQMHKLLKQMDSNQKKSLDEIKKSTTAIEKKLSAISDRMDSAEARIGALEDAAVAAKSDPPVTASQMDSIRKWIDDLEARGRRNNLRFSGFPEGCEEGNAVAFLEKLLPQLLDIQFPRGLIIERAHRTLTAQRNGKSFRSIIAKFLNFQDVKTIQRAAREKSNVEWRGQKICVFPDYTRSVEAQRKRFTECKKRLRERGANYALIYPATLKIFLDNGVERRFEDAKKALEFIDTL